MAEADADLARWRRNLLDERDSAELYRRIADAEDDETLASVYRRLAAAEERHAALWEQRLRDADAPVPPARVGWRTKLLGWLARRVGTANRRDWWLLAPSALGRCSVPAPAPAR